jgi:nicotinate-nucleotide adenylyltransferase
LARAVSSGNIFNPDIACRPDFIKVQAMLREKRRIAFFGGSFDPVHSGHLQMARAATEHLRLHRVYFVPAAQNPLKLAEPLAPVDHRLEMLRLAIRDDPAFGIWDGELTRDGPSYTLESVEHLERVYPNSHLFWIIGTDQVSGLQQWRSIEKLVQKVGFILVRRPGYEAGWPGIPGLVLYPVDNPLHPVSATEIRSRCRTGQSISGLVCPAVESHIRQHRLYMSD